MAKSLKEIELEYANLCAILGDLTVRRALVDKQIDSAIMDARNKFNEITKRDNKAAEVVQLPETESTTV